jgi:hypothetical protein
VARGPDGVEPKMCESWSVPNPKRFLKPTPSAKGTFSGWLGVFLDTPGDAGVDWEEIAEILEDAFRLVAPASAVAQRDRRSTLHRGAAGP